MEMMQATGGQPMQEDQMLELEARTAQLIAEGMTQLKQVSSQLSAPGPDPLVQLKEKELQVRAQGEENDAQIDRAKLGLEQQKVQQRDAQFDKRLESQEKQTAARINAAERREVMKQQKGGQ
jgi:2-succinyl-5-enolpyruvyl-6-hydroxy-3-cyclohexene-1-carboxylate synthase